MNFSKQLEGSYCKLCKKTTHDLKEHMMDHYKSISQRNE